SFSANKDIADGAFGDFASLVEEDNLVKAVLPAHRELRLVKLAMRRLVTEKEILRESAFCREANLPDLRSGICDMLRMHDGQVSRFVEQETDAISFPRPEQGRLRDQSCLDHQAV